MPDVSGLALLSVDASRRVMLRAPEGSTVEDMVRTVTVGHPGIRRDWLRVTVGGHVIEPHRWHRVRPKAGADVLIRLVPQGGGGNNLLRMVLMIAVVIAAAVVAPYLAPAFTAIGIGANTALALAQAGLVIAGSLLVNALVPASMPKLESPGGSNIYSITGASNRANPFGAVPVVLGRHRVYPVYAALPYTELIGDDQYFRALFVVGYGPLRIENIRLGDTPLSEYDDYQIEVREGWPDDAECTLFPGAVIEDSIAVALNNSDGWTGRFTASDVSEIGLDYTFPNGHFNVTNKGKYETGWTVTIKRRYRLVGATDWTDLPDLSFSNLLKAPFRRGERIALPEPGQYEVQVLRTSDEDSDQSRNANRIVWSILRGFRAEQPINFRHPLSLIALRIRATDQLSGAIETLNCDATSYGPEWDSGEAAWVWRPTQQPAALARLVMEGPANAVARNADQMALADLAEWAAWCDAKGLRYNRVWDQGSSVYDVLADVMRAGRAAPRLINGRWGVLIDRPRDLVVAHVTPRNSWDFSWERPLPRIPDAWRVRFVDETSGYAQAEMIVPRPGLAGDPELFEGLEISGLTDPEQVYRAGLWRWGEVMYRAETITVMQDFEALGVTRGDLVMVAHDILDSVQMAARVTSVSGSLVMLDDTVMMTAGQSYAVRFRRGDGSSLLRVVQTRAGESRALLLAGAGDVPAAGDLALFGLAGSESVECIVKSVEAADNLCARLTLVPHAPEIEALADETPVPAWSGGVSIPVPPDQRFPPAPMIEGIAVLADGIVRVAPLPAQGSAVPIGRFRVRHRLSGAPSWRPSIEITTAEAVALIEGYGQGDEIDLSAQSLSVYGRVSDWSPAVTYTVDISAYAPLDLAALTVEALGGGVRYYSWALGLPPDDGDPEDIAGYRIRGALGAGLAWGDLDALHDGLLPGPSWMASAPAGAGTWTIGIVAVGVTGRESAAPLLVEIELQLAVGFGPDALAAWTADAQLAWG